MPEFEGDLDAVHRRASELVGTVRFPSLAAPHSLVAKLLQADEERRLKQAASKWSSSWDAPIFDSKPERRRLRILNALLLALARCGCNPSVDRRAAYELHAKVGDMGVGFVLAPIGFNRAEYDRNHSVVPNKGKLKLELSWYQPPPEIVTCWQDQDDVPLESQLTDIVVGLLVAGEWSLRRGILRRHEYLLDARNKAETELRCRAEAAKRVERELREKIERERREQLIADAGAWRRANDVRAYVAARLRAEEGQLGAGTGEGIEAWARWALAEADRLDPLCRAAEVVGDHAPADGTPTAR